MPTDVGVVPLFMPIMRKVLFYIPFLFILLNSCSPHRKAEENYTPTLLKELNLGVMPSMDYLPFAVAQQVGIYDSLGLTLHFKVYNSAEERDMAFHRGSVDGAFTDLLGAIRQQNDNNQGKVVMRTDGFYTLMAQRGIKNLHDMYHTDIAISNNTAIDFLTGVALQTVGLNTQVNKPEINDIQLRITLLTDKENNRVSASFLPDPGTTLVKSNGLHALTNSNLLGYRLNVLMFEEEAITNKREEIKVLLQGYNLALIYMRLHPREIWKKDILAQWGINKKTARTIQLPTYIPASLPSERDVRLSRIWLRSRHLLNPKYDTYHLIDSSFINISKKKIIL